MIDAIRHLLPKKALDPWEADSIQDVLDAAVEWQEGRLPLEVMKEIGAISYDTKFGRGPEPSPGYTRFLAVMMTTNEDPRRAALLAATDAIIALD